jgi:predicted transcriptional regulator
LKTKMTASLALDPAVVAKLAIVAAKQERSKSFIANKVLVEGLAQYADTDNANARIERKPFCKKCPTPASEC